MALDSPFEAARDNWAHRSDGMRCMSCMWFVQKAARPVPVPTEPHAETRHSLLGRCRRRAPTMAGFPAVFDTDWCGDHKLDEEKV